MGTTRHLNGGSGAPPSDYLLDSVASATSYGDVTMACWIKRDAITATINGIVGRLFAANNGWSFFVDAANNLVFRHDALSVSIPCPDLSEWSFIAITYVPGGGADNVKFYYGRTPADLAVIGTATTTGTFTELGVFGIIIGWVTFGNLLSINSWNGHLDQIGWWTAALSLADLKTFMACDTIVQAAQIKFIVMITGANPEPGYIQTGLLTGSWGVNGTTVVTQSNFGCDAVSSAGAGGDDDTDDNQIASQICNDTI